MKNLVLDWLYENSLRSYPVRDSSLRTDGSFTLADNVIVDAQFVFEEIPANFRLTTLTKASDITWTFSNGLVITTPAENSRTRTAAGHLLVLGDGAVDIPNGTYNLSVYFEPSVIHEYGGEWLGVTSLQFTDDQETGDFHFFEGYQFDINLTGQNINFNVGNIFGTPIGCTRFSDYPEDCDTIISYISTTTPDGNHQIFLRAGPGMVVWDDPDNHRLYVGFAFTSAKDICPDIPPFPLN